MSGGNYGQNLKIPFCNMVVNKGKLWSKFENHFLKNGFPFPCFFWPQVALGWLLGCQGFRGKLVALLLFENAFRNRIEEAVANCKPPPLWIYFSTAWFSKQALFYRGRHPSNNKGCKERFLCTRHSFLTKGKPSATTEAAQKEIPWQFQREGLQQQQGLHKEIP